MLTCLCDPGGPIRRRIPVLISFTLIGAGVTAVYGLLREFGPAVALPLGVFGLFCSSFVRIYGQAPQQVAALLSVVQILSLDRGNPSLAEAAVLAAAFIGGSVWAILLTMVIWRIYPFLPARRAGAEAYRKLSELVADLLTLVRAPNISEAAWEAHARVHRRASREALEAARTIIMDTLRVRGAASNRAVQAVIRLETAEQLFGNLIALSDLLEHASQAERRAAERALRRVRPVLLILARRMISDEAETPERINRVIDAIAADANGIAAGTAMRAVIERIIERLRIVQTISVPANLQAGVDAAGRPMPIWPRIIQPLRANLSWKSPALRHALRTAVTAAVPLGCTMFWFTPYDHWVTITVAATMQPYFSLTYTRAIERVLGTVIGGLIAAMVGLVCTSPLATAAAMFPLAMLAFAVRAVSFGLFMMALTPLVVLLVESGTPDTGEWIIALVRAAFTTIGGLIAVGANFLLWPSREPDLVAAEVKSAITAHAAYAEADFSVLLEETSNAALGQTRRAAGVTTNSLEALITRALLEPGRRNQDTLEAAMVIDAALRRFAGRLTVLPYDPTLTVDTAVGTVRAWRDWVTASMRLLANGVTELPARPSGSDNDALGRIARQIDLMAGAMTRVR